MAPLNMSIDAMPEKSRRLYDEIKAKRGRIDGMYRTLLNHPDLAEHVSQLGTYLRFGSTLPGDVREVTILLVAQALGADYERVMHKSPAIKAGVSEAVIEAICGGGSLAEFNPDYGLLAELRDSVLARRNLPETIQGELVAKWGVEGLLELVVLVGFYGMINGILTSFDVPVPPA